jgi:hypothetical protein
VVLGDVEVDGDSIGADCFAANLSKLLQRTAQKYIPQDNVRLPLALQTKLKVRSQHHGQVGVRLCWPTPSRSFRHRESGAIYGPGSWGPPIVLSARLLRGLRRTVVTSCTSSKGLGWLGGTR